MNSTIKTVSLINSDNIESNNIKTVSLLDSDNTTTQYDTKEISLFESDKDQVTIKDSCTEKTISFLDYNTLTEFSKNETSTILNEDTKQFMLDKFNKKINIGFKTINELLKIPKNTCIKYKFKNSKFKWGILSDIILFKYNTIIILAKGPHMWKHSINFKDNIYYYILHN